MVPPNLDVFGHDVGDSGRGSAEHDILGRCFEKVVDDLERARPRPASDGLGISSLGMDVGDMTVDDPASFRVESYAAFDVRVIVPVHVATIDDEIGWDILRVWRIRSE